MQAIQNVHLRWKCKTRRVSVFHLKWKCKTRRVSVFHLRWKCKTRRVSVLLLSRKYKTRRVSVFHLRWKCFYWWVWRMFLSGSLFFISFSFLDKRKGGKRKSRRQGRRPNCPGTSKIFDIPRSMRIETCRVCDMSPPDTPQTKQPDTFTHAGLHSHSDGRAVHSQK